MVIVQKCAAPRGCQTQREKRRNAEEVKNHPRGGYSAAGDNMVKAAGTLQKRGRLPGEV